MTHREPSLGTADRIKETMRIITGHRSCISRYITKSDIFLLMSIRRRGGGIKYISGENKITRVLTFHGSITLIKISCMKKPKPNESIEDY